MFNSLRIREDMPTRRKKKRPKTLNVPTDRGDLELPFEDTFAIRPIVAFAQAGILRQPPVKEQGFVGAILSVQAAHPLKRDAWQRHRVRHMDNCQTFHVESLALLYAKICHGFAVAWFGIDSFEHWLSPYILGDDPCLSYLVGGMPGGELPYPVSHQASWRLLLNRDNLIVVNLRLFANLGGPWSHVVVGRASDALVDRIQGINGFQIMV